jgi:gamma-glutamylcyclotransferase (GGCT)/AIG2-like uncharacterized protein YtfP
VQAIYFAYGSNLSTARLVRRVPSATAIGRARLDGFRLTTDKRGRDGTAKANLARDPAAWVWGALYALDPAHWPDLDRCEGGYARMEVSVEIGGGRIRMAWTYASDVVAERPLLLPEYKAHIVTGAREHGLPAEWLALLESLPELGR